MLYLDLEVGLMASSEGMSVVERFLLGSTTVLRGFNLLEMKTNIFDDKFHVFFLLICDRK